MCIHIARDGKSWLFEGRFVAARFLMKNGHAETRRRGEAEVNHRGTEDTEIKPARECARNPSSVSSVSLC